MTFIVSLSPIAILIFLMTKKNGTPSHVALPATAVLVCLIKLVYFGEDANLTNVTVLNGMLTALIPILIIWGAIFMSVEALSRAYNDNLFYVQGRFLDVATLNDYYMAAAYTVRDRLLARWIKTAQTYRDTGARTVAYLSAEFLLGPHLANNLINLGIVDNAREAARTLDLDFDGIVEEEEPGLGNGGLGRLAACYLDSLATPNTT